MDRRPEIAGVSIVDYAPRFASAFHDLNVEWLDRYFEVEPVDCQVLGDPQGEILDHGGIILFAILEGQPVGTVALKHHGNGVFELTKMAVTASCQGLGIGRQLGEAAVDRFRKARGQLLYLESHSSLTPALRLYEALGFRHAPPPTASVYRRADVYMCLGGASEGPQSASPEGISPGF